MVICMTGHMVRTTSSIGHRFFIVAIANKHEAESAVRERMGDDEQIISAPLPEQVFAITDVKEGEIREWRPD